MFRTLLNIKSIVSLMGDNDKELSEMFGDNYRNFKHGVSFLFLRSYQKS